MIKREDLDQAKDLDRRLRSYEAVYDMLVHHTTCGGTHANITVRLPSSASLDSRIKMEFILTAIESEISDMKRELSSLGVWIEKSESQD